MLSTVDQVIVGAYIICMTLFGVWFTNKQKDLRTYFVGDRSVGWFMVLMSIVATETSAVTFLSVPGVGFNRNGGNLTFLQLSIGYIIGRCIVAWFLLPQYMSGNLFSAYQVLQQRFNPIVQRVASGLFMITRTVADGLRLFLTALLIQYIGLTVETAILVVGIVTIVYTYLGGMKAVIWTDLIQFVIKISGAALAGVFVLRLLPGGWDELMQIGEANNKFKMFEFGFDYTSSANIWASVLGGAVFSMASHGADQLMVQRYLCAKSLGQARVALVLSGIIVMLQFLLFLMVGVGMFALHSLGEFQFPATGREPANDEIFSLFIITKLPVGVVGILVAAVLAAAMSTLSSSLNSSANAFVTDFYRPLRPNHPEKWYVLLSRIMTAVWGVAQMMVAYAAFTLSGNGSVVMKVLAVAGFTTGLLLGLFILGSFKKPVTSTAALIGMICGFLAVLIVWLPTLTPVADKLRTNLPNWFPADKTTAIALAWPWYAPVGAGTTVLVALVVNRIMAKKPAS